MKRTLVAVAVTAALFSGGAFAQAAAPAPKAAPKAAAAAPAAEKQLYSQAQYDVLLKERLAQGGQDTPEIRNAVKEELNTRELLAREAKKSGVDKNPDVKTQMDLASQTVLVRVKGDSMVDAGILEGDLVVVEKQPTAKKGDIVVAIVDGQFTLKRLDVDRGQFILRAENKAYAPIRPEGALEVFGVMVGLVRKM